MTVAQLRTALDVALDVLRGIADTPRNRGARRRAAACVAFLESQLGLATQLPEPRRRGRPRRGVLTDERRRELTAAIERRASYAEIAAVLGVHLNTAVAIVRHEGLLELKRSHRGVARGKERRRLTDEERATVAEMIVARTPLAEIADRLSCNPQTASQIIRREGLGELHAAHYPQPVHGGIARTHADTMRRMAAAGHTLEQIGQAVGVTRERVRQVLEKYGCNAIRKGAIRQSVAAARWQQWSRTKRGGILIEAHDELKEKLTVALVATERQGWELRIDGAPVRVSMPVRASRTGPNAILYYRTHIVINGAWYLIITPDGHRRLFAPTSRHTVYVRATPYMREDADSWRERALKPAYEWRRPARAAA